MTTQDDAAKVAVLRIEGTNSEDETVEAFRELGADAEAVHMNQLDAEKVPKGDHRRLDDYDVLVFPGGFSAGDYIRAGAIWAARFKSRYGDDLEDFVASGRPVLGICNGFQVLVELGLLPTLEDHMAEVPEAALHLNDSDHYECRPVLLRHETDGSCVFTRNLPRGEVVTSIASHAEGKFLLPFEQEEELLRKLEARDQVVFRYVTPDGDDPTATPYPWNPNGSPGGIAAVSNPQGNVLGMMPHPERVFYRWQHPDWTRTHDDPDGPGDGRVVFQSVLDHLAGRS